MADDFGDDAGQQIFDWALRLGLEGYRRGGGPAGQRAVEEAIGRLEAALESARDAIGAQPEQSGGAPKEARTDARFARLDMSEFAELEDGQRVISAVDAKLAANDIWHGMTEDGGTPWLVFKTADAPAVASTFDQLVSDTRKAASRAAERIRQEQEREGGSRGADRDREPLKERAERARRASEAQSHDAERDRVPEQDRVETRSK
ncbi:hypothetical protein [Olsenella porci]|uniref:DUF3801 domain-containing protein n=1 Tax=Olsenella porci TaxID=2652279 RepID=A0A6N7XE79_9ACTN|nr:hypothetical protein [Olsenella porci]MST72623.1 hypothetical protein [Olsenella porci]